MARSAARALLDAHVTHADWQAQVIALARLLGWEVFWTKYSLASPPGWPDCFCLRPRDGRALAIELKTERYPTVTPAQAATLDALAACGIPSYVFFPRDFEALRAVLT